MAIDPTAATSSYQSIFEAVERREVRAARDRAIRLTNTYAVNALAVCCERTLSMHLPDLVLSRIFGFLGGHPGHPNGVRTQYDKMHLNLTELWNTVTTGVRLTGRNGLPVHRNGSADEENTGWFGKFHFSDLELVPVTELEELEIHLLGKVWALRDADPDRATFRVIERSADDKKIERVELSIMINAQGHGVAGSGDLELQLSISLSGLEGWTVAGQFLYFDTATLSSAESLLEGLRGGTLHGQAKLEWGVVIFEGHGRYQHNCDEDYKLLENHHGSVTDAFEKSLEKLERAESGA